MDERNQTNQNWAYHYNDFAYLYDLFFAQFTEDLETYLKIVRREGLGPDAKILELACGTGRLMLPLARVGYTVTGLDLSPAMLELFRKKLIEEPPELQQRVQLVEGDMTRLDQTLVGEKFDLIILAFSSFQYLLEEKEQVACLNSVYDHLKPGGLFVIAVTNPMVDVNNPASKRIVFRGSFPNPANQSTVNLFVSTTDFLELQQQKFQYQFYEKLLDSTTKITAVPTIMHYFYPEQLRALLEESRFAIENFYGSYYLDEYSPNSSRIIYTCRLAPAI